MSTTLTRPVIRRLTAADGEAALAVSLACDVAEMGEEDTDITDILRDMDLPGSEWFGIDDPAGALVAIGFAVLFPSHSHAEVEVRVLPDADPALGDALVPVVRAAADRLTPGRPVHGWGHADNAVKEAWYAAVGGTRIRHFWRMVVDFGDDPPPAPDVPPGAEIVLVGEDETLKRDVFEVVETSFEDHFGHDSGTRSSYEDFVRRTHTVSGFDPRLWWLATVDDRPAAALIGRAIPEYGLVNTLGTLREWRGRGLGRALLQTSFVAMHARGYRRICLGVDSTNPTGAVRLYESVGMRADQTFAIYELPPTSGGQ